MATMTGAVRVPLPMEARLALDIAARRDLREPEAQAAYLLIQALGLEEFRTQRYNADLETVISSEPASDGQ